MLIWSRKGRAAAGALAVTLFAGVFPAAAGGDFTLQPE
ncbi:2-aminoethylphosphonate ABC transporter permease protein II (TC 3.A.1.9.1) [Klebsiella pneumoniae IS39]|nr:2-aminoethylphosphonate ABC transporter permease protein II (TC 3.A.1.9.1) [Klebsiella pneumoniae IS39]